MSRVCPECGRRFEDAVSRCPEDGSPTLMVSKEDDLVGREIDGRFTVAEMLGRGGMGAVYRARQHSMDRDVALKVLRRELTGDEKAVRRFFHEARAASRLANPHTVTVFDFGQSSDGLLYIAMEMLRGRPLSTVIREEGKPLDPVRAVGIAGQLLDSLTEAHSVGVLHRDIKPDNIFLLEGPSTRDFVKVLDFGIAKIQDADTTNLTATGMAFGTPTYMSPEQAKAGELGPRSDIYSVGVVLFEMLAGKPPFQADTPMALVIRKVQEIPPTVEHVNPDVQVPVALSQILARILSPKAEDRPVDATEARMLLEQAMVTAPTMTGPLAALEVTSQGDGTMSFGLTGGAAAVMSGVPDSATPRRGTAANLAANLARAAAATPTQAVPMATVGEGLLSVGAPVAARPRRRLVLGLGLAALVAVGLLVAILLGSPDAESPTAAAVPAVVTPAAPVVAPTPVPVQTPPAPAPMPVAPVAVPAAAPAVPVSAPAPAVTATPARATPVKAASSAPRKADRPAAAPAPTGGRGLLDTLKRPGSP